jgi:hypothetical protein
MLITGRGHMDDDVPVETVRGLAGPDRRHYSMDARDGWDSGSAQSLSKGAQGKARGGRHGEVCGSKEKRRSPQP